jgi:hypothetical protein
LRKRLTRRLRAVDFSCFSGNRQKRRIWLCLIQLSQLSRTGPVFCTGLKLPAVASGGDRGYPASSIHDERGSTRDKTFFQPLMNRFRLLEWDFFRDQRPDFAAGDQIQRIVHFLARRIAAAQKFQLFA